MTATLPRRPAGSRRLADPGPGWWRAPTQAVRSPGLAIALLAAVALLTLATASRPLFTTLVGDRALADELGDFRAEELGVSITVAGNLERQPLGAAVDAVRGHMTNSPLGSPLVEVRPREAGSLLDPASGEGVSVTYPFGFPVEQVQLYARSGAVEHLPEADGDGDGIWIPRRIANAAGVDTGDELALRMRGHETAMRVAGTYRDLPEVLPTSIYTPPDALPHDDPIVDFWQPRQGLVTIQTGDGTPTPAPALLVGTPDDVIALGGADFRPFTTSRFVFPYDPADDGMREAAAMLDLHERLEAAAVDATHPLGEPLRAAADMPGGNVAVSSLLEGVVERPTTLVATLDGSLAPVALGAQALAFATLGAVALGAALRRRTEQGMLSVQGTGVTWVAGRALLEAGLPALAGGLVGGAAAVAVVVSLGDAGAFPDPESLRQVARASLGAALTGLGVWALVAVVARPRGGGTSSGKLGRFLARAPWELLLIAAAVAAGITLFGREGGMLVTVGDTQRMDLLAVGFPVLLVAAVAGVAARGLVRLGPALRRGGSRAPAPIYLAVRAIAAAPASARASLAGVVVGVGLLMFAVIAAASIDATIEAKASAVGGAQTSLTMPPREAIPADLGVPHTEVLRTVGTLEPAGREVAVLAIDPGSFGDAAVWVDAFADEPLEVLLERLRAEGDTLPVIVAGRGITGVERLRTDRYELEVEPVASLAAFPGMADADRVVVVDADRLVAAANETGTTIDELLVLRRRREIWLAAGQDVAEQLRTSVHLGWQRERGAEEIARRPDLQAASWTLGYLRMVGIAAGVLALVGLLGHAAGRRRRRAAGLALARRMGLSRSAARGALAVELGGLGLIGGLLGAVAGFAAAWAVIGTLDPLPGEPPDPFIALPGLIVVVALLAVPLSATLGGFVAGRSGRRERAANLLRDGAT